MIDIFCLFQKRPLLIVAKDVELEVGGSLFLDKTYLQTAVIKVRGALVAGRV